MMALFIIKPRWKGGRTCHSSGFTSSVSSNISANGEKDITPQKANSATHHFSKP